MEGLIAFWSASGIANFTGGQVLMMAVGGVIVVGIIIAIKMNQDKKKCSEEVYQKKRLEIR